MNKATALLAVLALGLTGCSASSASPAESVETAAVQATAEATDPALSPQQKAAAFLQEDRSGTTISVELAAQYPEYFSDGSHDGSNKADPNYARNILGLIYGGFPEHQKASFEWTEDEAKKVEAEFEPLLYDGFEGQFSESLRKNGGGLIITSANTMSSGTNPRVYAAKDGSSCAMTDDPWGVKIDDAGLDLGPEVSPSGGAPQRTIRLDYTTTFDIKCASGGTLTFTQPKHLSFIEQGGERLAYEYGRGEFTDSIKPAS